MEVWQKTSSTGVDESMMRRKVELHVLTGDMQIARHALLLKGNWSEAGHELNNMPSWLTARDSASRLYHFIGQG
jgi:hypothetical protein